MRKADSGGKQLRSIRNNRVIALASIAACAWPALAQTPEIAGVLSSPAIVYGQPFSADRFSRKVHVGKDGVAVTVSESSHASLARDRDGRVFMADVASESGNCDLPGIGTRPTCPFWALHLFDPAKGVMWHWLNGDTGDKTQYVQIDMQSEEIDEAERDTSELKDTSFDSKDPVTHVQSFGEHYIEGIQAKGVRITILHWGETGDLTWTFHEVWTSERMHLVIRIVNGSSDGDMVISGLEHISLTPSVAKFQLPVERILRHPKNDGSYAMSDLRALATWLVQ